MRSFLPSALLLGAVAVLAVYLSLVRNRIDSDPVAVRAAVRLVLIGIFSQAVHFSEELSTGFHERFPELLGLPPIPLGFFVSFNVGWLLIWCLSAYGLSAGVRLALFPIWFLAIASAMNGLAHPLMALRAGGYFPGLLTSPLVGVLGILMLRRLSSLTSR